MIPTFEITAHYSAAASGAAELRKKLTLAQETPPSESKTAKRVDWYFSKRMYIACLFSLFVSVQVSNKYLFLKH